METEKIVRQIRRPLYAFAALLILAACNDGKKNNGSETEPPTPVENKVDFEYPTELAYNYTYPSQAFLSITTTESWEITITDPSTGEQIEWLRVSADSGKGNKLVGIYNDVNEEYARSATLKVDFESSDHEITISQAGRYEIITTIPQWTELPEVKQTESRLFVPHYATMHGERARNYSMLYDLDYKTALWVAYPLHKDYIGSGNKSSWTKNPQIPEQQQIRVSSGYGVSYPEGNNNVYARGHQIPNGDRNGIPEMQSQTYYYTNSTPQIQNGFNNGVWSTVETLLRNKLEADTIWIVSGPVFQTAAGNEEVKYITNSTNNGGGQVPVANYYYKIALKAKRSSYSAVGFWFEHKYYSPNPGAKTMSCTVRQIEQKTGINFFANLPQEVQDSFETTLVDSDWFP